MKVEEFQLWADVIRSGQVSQERVPSILEENPEFDKWYREKYIDREKNANS